MFNRHPFNTHHENELGGCSSKNDIECNMNSIGDISIEIKNQKHPIGCNVLYNIKIKNGWEVQEIKYPIIPKK